MKKCHLQDQSKFPSLSVLKRRQQKQLVQKKVTSSIQLVRIILALLISIIIYNTSQQTTINYNQIIKNQKMFLVKNIRGVIPILNGTVQRLKGRQWRVVHLDNFNEKQSEILNSFTLMFNPQYLYVQNQQCQSKFKYQWKNYSYNIDIRKTATNQVSLTDQNQSNVRTLTNQSNILNTNVSTNIINTNISPNPMNRNQTKSQSQSNPTLSSKSQQQSETLKAEKCVKSKNFMGYILQRVSVWTISGNYLYLLVQHANIEEDFYLILQYFH